MCGSLPDWQTMMGPSRLNDDARFRILRLLEENPEMSQRELADAVGVSVGCVNYVLKALVEKGLVKLGNFSANPDKRRYAYVMTPKGLAEKSLLARNFLRRKVAEYEALRSEIEELQRELEAGAGGLRADGR